MKRGKLFSAVLTSAFVVSALVGLSACGEPPHTHEFSEHTFYCVKTEEQQDKVYSFKVCDCGENDTETLVENAIIVDETTADSIVRGHLYDLTNKVVVFKKGTYSSSIAGGTKNYHNVIFAGEYTGENKEVVFEAGSYLYTQGSYSIDGLEYNNISFKNRLFLGSQTNDIKNVDINNCSFVNEDADKGDLPAILIAPKVDKHVTSENIVVKNCSIDGFYQGILIYQNKNLTIENNIIKNTIHNAVGIQLNSGYTNKITGTISISNNEILNIIGPSQTGERAIRFGQLENATITVANNKFLNAVDGDSEILKASGLVKSTISFTNNTNAGEKIPDKEINAQSPSFAIVV
ncbi:MAG: hypothetical protein J6K39_01170 [Clostridia bacterium]|nr:hypothetical protein [Clostridia bacterium]